MDETGSGASYMRLKQFFLARLERSARLSNQIGVRDVPHLRRLTLHTTLSFYRDCVSLGIENEARQTLLRIAEQSVITPPPPSDSLGRPAP